MICFASCTSPDEGCLQNRGGVACDLRIEIIIISAQPIERLGIFVVTDRAQRTGKTPKEFAFCGVC